MPTRYKQRVPKKYIGSYAPRSDGFEKASGKAEYFDDIALKSRHPGLLYAKVLRSPYPHARIKSVGTIKAEALVGVHAVLTFQDPEIAAMKPTQSGWSPFYTNCYDRMLWPNTKDRRILDSTVRWVGDEAGVVVAAESPEIAEEALRLLEIDWEVLPFVMEPQEAMKPGAPIIHPEINPNGNLLPPSPDITSPVFVERGDAEKALTEADVVVNVSTEYANSDQGCLGTRACLMKWEGDKLTCWTSYYEADQTRMHLTQMLNLPLHKVRVINPYIGGSFGRGNIGEQPFFIFTAILAKRTRRPVVYQLTRREDFHDTRNRVMYDCRMGAMKDGTITAIHLKSIGDSGAYSEHTMAATDFVVREWAEATIGNIPNLHMETYVAYTNKIPGGIKRGIGHNQVNFVFCLALDEMAEKLEMDPVELAIKNIGFAHFPMPGEGLEAVLWEGARRIGWSERHKPAEGPIYGGTRKRGLGFSVHNSWHAAWQEVPRGHIQVSIRLNPDGTVILDAPTAETGVGSNVCNVLACAEKLNFLGITPQDITWISNTDTERGLKDQVQTDSAVSYIQAEVMGKAALSIKNQVAIMAAQKFKVTPEDVDIQDGKVFVRSTEEEISIKDLLWNGDLVPIWGTVSETLPGEVTGTPFLATFAEVEVDSETGRVEVLKLVVVNDLGTVMYASGAEGQQVGGQAMAIGEALTEELIYDPNTGVPLDFNWIDYKIPTILDVSEIEPVLLEVWKGTGEFGACGIGESVTTCAPRAIANAIYNAVGVRINIIPITPEKVLAALGKITQPSTGKAR
jgi:CO/xanthine dehydrogenase Mo-binding subunit